MKYFVTGATGHIGNVLVKKLYQKGYNVTSLVLPNDSIQAIEPYTDIIYGNILDAGFIKNTIKDYDVVLHLAGMVDIGSYKKKKIYNVNIEGTRNIIKACQENNIERLLYVSSVHAFKVAPHGEIMQEPLLFNPDFVKGNYAKTKAIASDLVLNQKSNKLETILVCPSGVIGPYDYQLSNSEQLFIDFLIGRLLAYIKGSYNFVDVRDLAEGIISASIKGKDKDIFILAGHDITVKELLDKIADLTGKKKLTCKLWYPFIIATSYVAELYYKILKQKPLFTNYSVKVLRSNHLFSNNKAKRILGFKIRPIEETIRDTINFTKEYYLTKKGKKWKKKKVYK